MMSDTLTIHINLIEYDGERVALRYYIEQPSAYEERVVALGVIERMLKGAEREYYTVLPADFVQVGQALYRWLDGADRFLATPLEACRGKCRVVVLAIAMEGRLAHLPWELLHDGTSFLVARQDMPIVPVRWRRGNVAALAPQNRPLQLLFMATSPLNVTPVLDFEREEGLILAATRKQPLVLTVEESGELVELENLIASYGADYFDVFHLTGHATHTKEGPRFLTETEVGDKHEATAFEIKDALIHTPRLIFLSGCRTAEAAKAGSVPSLAQSLLDVGFPCVLGWGRPVLDQEATDAAAALYEALAKGLSLGRALAKCYQVLIQAKARDWHLLRLYMVGQMLGALVTPLKTRGRKRAPRLEHGNQFLDQEQRVKVPNRQEFVGRRRPLQRCLRTLRYADDQIGLILHGMGGIGKSSLSARLVARLPEYKTIVWVGRLDEDSLLHKLARHVRQRELRALLNADDGLEYRLLALFEQLDEPLLLVWDDFEANFEQRGGVIDLPDGSPRLSVAATHLLKCLSFALRESRGEHRLIITTRYTFDLATANDFYHESLTALPHFDVDKKVKRLLRGKEGLSAVKALKARAITIADGNPRLLEWLFEILAQGQLEHATILDQMAAKATEFRAQILAAELLKQQAAPLCQLLAHLLIYELPVPQAAITAICQNIPDLARHQRRAAALGLLEASPQANAQTLWRVPRILAPLLKKESPADPIALVHRAAQTLYQLWWLESDNASEEQALEIHRLALQGQVTHIAVEMARRLAKEWYKYNRFREGATLSEKSLRTLGDDYRLLHQLARAEKALGEVEEALKHYQQALQTCPPEDEYEKATIKHNMAVIYSQQGEIERALALYQESLEMMVRIGNVQELAATLHNMAVIYRQEGEIERALRLYQESGAIYEWLGDVQGQAATLHQLAGIYSQQGENERALSLYQQSLEMRERISHVQGQAATLHQMAGIYSQQGENERALRLYQQSLEMEEGIGNLQGQAATLHQMAGIYSQRGESERALALYQQSLDIDQRIGDVRGQAATLHQLAGVYSQQGEIERALALYQQSLKMDQRIGDVQGQAATLHDMAVVYSQLGEIKRAQSLYQQSLEMRERIGDVLGRAATLYQLAGIYRQQGEIERALRLYQQSLEMTERISNVEGQAAILDGMAGIYSQQGELERALTLYRESLEIQEGIGNVHGKARTLTMMGQLLADEQGEFETALAYLEESEAILSRLKSPEVEIVKRIMARVRRWAEGKGS